MISTAHINTVCWFIILSILFKTNHMTQGKKLKNWYIQEHKTGTTFEPEHFKNALTKK